jgi:hypothetical protein
MPDVREVQRDIATMTRLLFRLDPDQRAALIALAEHFAGASSCRVA